MSKYTSLGMIYLMIYQYCFCSQEFWKKMGHMGFLGITAPGECLKMLWFVVVGNYRVWYKWEGKGKKVTWICWVSSGWWHDGTEPWILLCPGVQYPSIFPFILPLPLSLCIPQSLYLYVWSFSFMFFCFCFFSILLCRGVWWYRRYLPWQHHHHGGAISGSWRNSTQLWSPCQPVCKSDCQEWERGTEAKISTKSKGKQWVGTECVTIPVACIIIHF